MGFRGCFSVPRLFSGYITDELKKKGSRVGFRGWLLDEELDGTPVLFMPSWTLM